MDIIDTKRVVVLNHQEFKDILETDNDYEYIYLGADITLESGIKINEKK